MSRRPDRGVELPAVRTTIVGGRPPGCGKMIGPIPRGIEVLLKKASVDAAFRRLLLAGREKAADEIGLALCPSESAMLKAVPEATLAGIIDRTEVEPSKLPAFLGKAAAVMLVALGATTSPTARTARADPGGPQGDQVAQVAPSAGVRDPGAQPRTPASQPASQPTSYPALTAEEKEQLAQLLKQMDSDKFAEREAAYNKIKDMGTGVIPPLKDAIAGGKLSAEVRMRAQRIIDSYQPAPPLEVGAQRGDRAETYTMLGIRPVEPAPAPADGPPAVTTTSAPASQPTTTSAPASMPAEQKVELDRLIAKLGDDIYLVREGAQKRIVAMGAIALPVLRDDLAKEPETSERYARLTAIIARLEASTQPAPAPTPEPTRPRRFIADGLQAN